jgi:ParB family chromosome partitioning protein
VDTDAIALKVKHEFAAKEKARSAAKIEAKPTPKALKKVA